MKIHLLTLTWDASEKLATLYKSLLPVVEGLDYQWLIKSNGCKDNTCEIVPTWEGNIKLIKYPDNSQNFSQGMNYLFKESNAKDDDVVVLLNNDLMFNDKDSLKAMLSYLRGENGVVGAKLLFTGTNQLQHCGVCFNYRGFPMHFRAGQEDDAQSKKNRYFQAVTGAIMAMKAKDYVAIGGLNENLRWAFDDIDACLKIKNQLKKKAFYCGETNIFHEESASLKKNPVNKLYMNHNMTTFLNTWRGKYECDLGTYSSDPNYNVVK